MSVAGYLQEAHKTISQHGGPDYRPLKFICQACEGLSIKFYSLVSGGVLSLQ
jgi:hypothetical protein